MKTFSSCCNELEIEMVKNNDVLIYTDIIPLDCYNYQLLLGDYRSSLPSATDSCSLMF